MSLELDRGFLTHCSLDVEECASYSGDSAGLGARRMTVRQLEHNRCWKTNSGKFFPNITSKLIFSFFRKNQVNGP